MSNYPVADNQAAPITRFMRELSSAVILTSSSILSAVYAQGQSFRLRLNPIRAELAASARRLAETASLAEAQAPEGGAGEKSGVLFGLSGLALALIIGAIVLLCVLPVCIIIVLALLGPAIGNVFSEINQGI